MDVLAQICSKKKEHVRIKKHNVSESKLLKEIEHALPSRAFYPKIINKIQSKETAIIAELKKASPSRGVIRDDFDVSSLAAAYERGGATCLSVLTDTPYFQGEDEYLKLAKSACSLPILRKDFILDPYQVLESKALGADCILLIMAALSDAQAQELFDTARELKLDVLVEVHNEEECERALELSPLLLGVNNRNLKTLEIDINTTIKILPMINRNVAVVCESGIYSYQDIKYMRDHGIYSFLIGESLMKQPNVEEAIKKLLI